MALRGLLERPRPLIHVSCSRERVARRGLFIHRAVLPTREIEIVDAVPTTTLPRTCLDLSAVCGERELRTLLKRAEFKGLLDTEEIVAILERYPRRRGRKTLAKIARSYAFSAGRTASSLEDDFMEFCVVRDIPPPETNVPIWVGGRKRVVDCLWREARVVAELDGRDAHTREIAFEEDRARDRTLTAADWRPVRVTSAQLRFHAAELAQDLLRLTSPDAA
jgi:hypothetical protein